MPLRRVKLRKLSNYATNAAKSIIVTIYYSEASVIIAVILRARNSNSSSLKLIYRLYIIINILYIIYYIDILYLEQSISRNCELGSRLGWHVYTFSKRGFTRAQNPGPPGREAESLASKPSSGITARSSN